MTKAFVILNFGHCDLPFDLAQGDELVEPFDICDLLFVISIIHSFANLLNQSIAHMV
jgi:hypothetical protein